MDDRSWMYRWRPSVQLQFFRERFTTIVTWFRQAISISASLNPKNVTSCLQTQSPRVDHNRDRVPDSRPHIASGRSNSTD
jgi:hypothetical protein